MIALDPTIRTLRRQFVELGSAIRQGEISAGVTHLLIAGERRIALR